MSLADYLAKNYLNADSTPEEKSKKRKRKGGTSSGLVIADDDTSGWERNGGDADDDGPLTGAEYVVLPSVAWVSCLHSV